MRSKLNVRAIIVIFAALSLFFAAELAVDLLVARGREPLDLAKTPEWARSYIGNMSRAANVLAQLVITAIALAIPLTSTIYTPKFTDLFIKDRTNQAVLAFMLLGVANAIFISYLARTGFTPRIGIAILEIQFTLAVAMLLPYYFYMLRSIDPSRITAVLADRAERFLVELARRREPAARDKDKVRERIHNLGNIILRSLDRSDRDVALEAVAAIERVLRRYAVLKRRFPESWFVPERRHFTGLSEAALGFLETGRTWVERLALNQLELAFQAALARVPDVVSEITFSVKTIAAEASENDDGPVLRMCIQFLNSFLREAIKRRDLRAVYDILQHYRRLARELLRARPETAAAIAGYLKYYAELARATGVPFVCELIGYDLAQIVEWAYEVGSDRRAALLETLLAIEPLTDGRASLRLTKAKVLLAAYFLEHGCEPECERVLAACGRVPAPLLRQIEKDFQETTDREFWEVTDRQVNFDWVAPERAPSVHDVMDRLRATALDAAGAQS